MDSVPNLNIFKIKVDFLNTIISDLILSRCRCRCKKTVKNMKINGTLLVDLEVEGEDALTSERKIKIDNLQIAKVQQKQRISSKNKISDIAIRNRTRK